VSRRHCSTGLAARSGCHWIRYGVFPARSWFDLTVHGCSLVGSINWPVGWSSCHQESSTQSSHQAMMRNRHCEISSENSSDC
jgi:hypothetical protein